MVDILKKIKVTTIVIILFIIVSLIATIPVTVNPILFINASLSSAPLASTTNTQTSSLPSSSAIDIMVGELISEGQGKIIGQRNIISEESQNIVIAKIEISYSGTANIKGIGNVSETWTFVNTHRPNDIIQGKGYGTIITEDGNGVATATEFGRGNTQQQINSTDESLNKIVYPGARFLFAETTGEMAFLNKIVGVTKWEVNTSTGNYKYKMWQLK